MKITVWLLVVEDSYTEWFQEPPVYDYGYPLKRALNPLINGLFAKPSSTRSVLEEFVYENISVLMIIKLYFCYGTFIPWQSIKNSCAGLLKGESIASFCKTSLMSWF